MKKTICTIAMAALCLFLTNTVRAQFIAPLKVGDKLPDLVIPNVINYKSPTLKLSDLKGKVLILDFWATWCGACLSTIPKTDTLQRNFADKVLFLSVTYQTDKEVDTYLARLEKLKPEIDVRKHIRVVEDKILHQLFPHTGLPHYVWINAEGVVSAITDYHSLTVANINRAFSEGTVNARLKKDIPLMRLNKEIPILSNLKGKVPEILGHTLFTRFIPGIPGGMDMIPPTDTSGRKISVRNVPLTWHYETAYGEGKQYFAASRISLEVKEPNKVKPINIDDYDKWLLQYGYCYELQLPRSLDSLVYIRMQDDLKKFFPQYEAFVEKRNLRVLALVRTSNIDKIATTGGKSTYAFSGVHAMMRNVSLSLLTSQLSTISLQYSKMPIINEAGYRVKVDLDLNADLSDVKSINKDLRKYDLKFVEKEKIMDVLVIRDRI